MQAGTCGSMSSKRFDLARNTIIAIRLPLRFCSYSIPLSIVKKTS